MKHTIFGLPISFRFENLTKTPYSGYYDSANKEVVICSSLKGHDRDHTILHEFFHAVWDRVGLNQANIPLEVQEIIVENFSTALLENFKLTKKKR